MSQNNISHYEVRITPRISCATDKSQYNADYTEEQEVEAQNYFQTLVERYQCYNYSTPTADTKQAMGQFYTITLTTHKIK